MHSSGVRVRTGARTASAVRRRSSACGQRLETISLEAQRHLERGGLADSWRLSRRYHGSRRAKRPGTRTCRRPAAITPFFMGLNRPFEFRDPRVQALRNLSRSISADRRFAKSAFEDIAAWAYEDVAATIRQCEIRATLGRPRSIVPRPQSERNISVRLIVNSP